MLLEGYFIKQNLHNYGTQDINIIIMFTLHTHHPSYLCHVEIGMEWKAILFSQISITYCQFRIYIKITWYIQTVT